MACGRGRHASSKDSAWNAERRTPNAERQNAERRTPNAERRTPNAERRTLEAPDAAAFEPGATRGSPAHPAPRHPVHVPSPHVESQDPFCHRPGTSLRGARAPVVDRGAPDQLTLVRPFETSFGRTDARIVPLVRMVADGVEGWGEIVADHEPLFSSETIATARHVLADCFIPALLSRAALVGRRCGGGAAALQGTSDGQGGSGARVHGPGGAFARRVDSRGHRRHSRSRARRREPRHREDDPDARRQVLAHVAQGYQRIKLKIKPGWDVDVVRTVARRLSVGLLIGGRQHGVHPGRRRAPAPTRRLRPADDRAAARARRHGRPRRPAACAPHRHLPRRVDRHARAAAQALALGSCRLINIKIGRVGGYTEALGIHDICQSARRAGLVRRHARMRHRPRAQRRAGEPAELLAAGRHLREQAVLGARRDHEAVRGRGRRHRRGADGARHRRRHRPRIPRRRSPSRGRCSPHSRRPSSSAVGLDSRHLGGLRRGTPGWAARCYLPAISPAHADRELLEPYVASGCPADVVSRLVRRSRAGSRRQGQRGPGATRSPRVRAARARHRRWRPGRRASARRAPR